MGREEALRLAGRFARSARAWRKVGVSAPGTYGRVAMTRCLNLAGEYRRHAVEQGGAPA